MVRPQPVAIVTHAHQGASATAAHDPRRQFRRFDGYVDGRRARVAEDICQSLLNDTVNRQVSRLSGLARAMAILPFRWPHRDEFRSIGAAEHRAPREGPVRSARQAAAFRGPADCNCCRAFTCSNMAPPCFRKASVLGSRASAIRISEPACARNAKRWGPNSSCSSRAISCARRLAMRRRARRDASCPPRRLPIAPARWFSLAQIAASSGGPSGFTRVS